MNLQLTNQQAIELEMLLQSVNDFGIQVEGVELEVYTPAIAQIHKRIKNYLDSQIQVQQPKDKRLSLEELKQLRDRWLGKE